MGAELLDPAALRWAYGLLARVKAKYPNMYGAHYEIYALMESGRGGDEREHLEQEMWRALEFTIDMGIRMPKGLE